MINEIPFSKHVAVTNVSDKIISAIMFKMNMRENTAAQQVANNEININIYNN